MADCLSPTVPKDKLHEILRVNQAGEFGATRIYAGQRAVFSKIAAFRQTADKLKEQEAEEQVHLETFNRLIETHQSRPTLLEPLWNVAGFGLGVATALMGEKAAHACTVAVETVIADHYQEQIDTLDGTAEAELLATIKQYRDEEIAHKNDALDAGAEQAALYPVLSGIIQTGCKIAIALAKRI